MLQYKKVIQSELANIIGVIFTVCHLKWRLAPATNSYKMGKGNLCCDVNLFGKYLNGWIVYYGLVSPKLAY